MMFVSNTSSPSDQASRHGRVIYGVAWREDADRSTSCPVLGSRMVTRASCSVDGGETPEVVTRSNGVANVVSNSLPESSLVRGGKIRSEPVSGAAHPRTGQAGCRPLPQIGDL